MQNKPHIKKIKQRNGYIWVCYRDSSGDKFFGHTPHEAYRSLWFHDYTKLYLKRMNSN